MKVCIALLMCGFMFLFASICAGDQVVYDFGDADAWEVITGNWEVIDGEYVSTGATSDQIALAVLNIDTADVEVIEYEAYDLGTGGWQNFFTVFGYDEANPISYLAGPFVGGAQEWRVETFDSVTKGSRTEVAGVADTLAPEKWYSVKVVFEGNDVILYGAERGQDLVELLRYILPEGKPGGKIGLGASNSEAKFDNVKITGASITSVDIDGKLATTWGTIKLSN